MDPEVQGEIQQLEALDADIARGIAMAEPAVPTVQVSALAPWRPAWHDGEKFFGGFGPTEILTTDYWTLRARSAQLFKTNLYARGIVRRFITNVINTGLHLESVPDEALLGFEEDALADWSELTESRFSLWERPRHCDLKERSSFGQLQAAAYREALVAGDVLVVLRQDRRTRLPRVQLIPGAAVQSPLEQPRRANRIEHGVELDGSDRQVAYWVTQRDGTSKRLPAWGEKSGRRIAWLVYATDKRLDDVRGEPLLSLVIQSLKEIDRYRDSVQRKAVINSMLAMFVKKAEEKMGTTPITGGAVRRGSVVATDTSTGETRAFNTADLIPGVVIDELQVGEEPQAFGSQGTDEKFGDFEEAIVQAVAWAMETPPEILRLAFSSNYSASQAAINEYKMFLNRARTEFGGEFCAPIYEDWLISEVLAQRIQAPGFLDARRDPTKYDAFGAWVASEWAGQIKPAVDQSKLANGYEKLLEMGLITRDRACRELTGMKFSKVVKRLRIENEQLLDALKALGVSAAPSPAGDTPSPEEPDEEPDDEPEPETDRAAAAVIRWPLAAE